ncbi:MAG: hypothetical protein Q8927_07595 [Bacteroidota bacterium]|nr:hypothetical protein [Bacteroidota bacterium]MDP4216050.1 hypothetical protein [Bacteroidota bacterium]MDP4248316.1 hypothetical protein [Bacteroidota bacterium]MDP4260657.1 hypothetical protein [Bacteroidota bacterium]
MEKLRSISTFLPRFQRCAAQLDRELFAQQHLEYRAGNWLRCAVLKFQNPSWINNSPKAKPFSESIFFGIWVSEESVRQGKLNYNIHALKLRELTGYRIKSREFADEFRARFKPFEKQWPNVRTDLGPLTLMQGWVHFDEDNLETLIKALSYQFLNIAFIIDDLLAVRRKC